MSSSAAGIQSPDHRPISYHVQRWSEEKYSQGAWSQLKVGGSKRHRAELAKPISKALILAGEACSPDNPSMVHGAAASGIRAARILHDAAVKAQDSHTKPRRAKAGKPQYMCLICTKYYFYKEDLIEHDKAYESFHKRVLKAQESSYSEDGEESGSDGNGVKEDSCQDPDTSGDSRSDYSDGSPSDTDEAERACAKMRLSQNLRTVVVGAGAAGIAAAAELKRLEGNPDIVILEARNRIGGRVNTIFLSGGSGDISVDSGGMWLEQFDSNPLVSIAQEAGLTLIPTDFHRPLRVTSDNVILSNRSVDDMLDRIVAETESIEKESKDCDLATFLAPWLHKLTENERELATLLLEGDIEWDSGIPLTELSAKNGLLEPGVGINDHFIAEGYSALLEHMVAGIPLRLEAPVKFIDWSSGDKIHLILEDDEDIICDRCICTIPISLIQNRTVTFNPPLPQTHRDALSKIRLGSCDKVLLRFEERWWPTIPGGVIKWYDYSKEDSGADKTMSWVEWADLTDGLGSPVVVAFLCGDAAISRWHSGKSDREVAFAATRALERFTHSVAIATRKIGAEFSHDKK